MLGNWDRQVAHPSATVCWGSIRNRGCILYPRLGTFVLIRPAHTFYERIKYVLTISGVYGDFSNIVLAVKRGEPLIRR